MSRQYRSEGRFAPARVPAFLGYRSGVSGWLVRFAGLFLRENLVVWAVGGQVAAVEIDRVGAEAALERRMPTLGAKDAPKVGHPSCGDLDLGRPLAPHCTKLPE